MTRKIVALATLVGLLAAVAGAGLAQEKDELADNPYYKVWASHKTGTTATQTEKVKYGPTNPDGKYLPGGVDHKDIQYKLVQVTKDKVVVETRVTDHETFSTVETAPTRITYPARIKKTHVDEYLASMKGKVTPGKVSVKGKSFDVNKVELTREADGVTTTEVTEYSDTVPGGLIRKKVTSKKGSELLTEATTVLVSVAYPAEPKEKGKDKPKEKGKDTKDKDKPKEPKDKPKEGK